MLYFHWNIPTFSLVPQVSNLKLLHPKAETRMGAPASSLAPTAAAQDGESKLAENSRADG